MNNGDYKATIPNGMRDQQDGLTKRELIAAMAMQGLLAGIMSHSNVPVKLAQEATEAIPKASILVADALLAELSKEEPKR
jgi:hypothetical protein